MPRVARDADAREIREQIEGFISFDKRLTLANLRKRRRSRQYVTTIEPGVGFCELQKLPDSIRVSGLYPRGVAIKRLKGALDLAFAQAAKRWPLDTRVWATFYRPVDAAGNPDGGESECKAWQRVYPGTRVYRETPRGRWVIESTLKVLLHGI